MSGALLEGEFSSLLFDQADAEIVEQHVGGDARRVSDLTVAGKSQVALIVRGTQSLIPTPDVSLQKGDRLVAIVKSDFVAQFHKLIDGALAKAVS